MTEPPQTAERRTQIDDPLARLPRLDMAYMPDAIAGMVDLMAAVRNARSAGLSDNSEAMVEAVRAELAAAYGSWGNFGNGLAANISGVIGYVKINWRTGSASAGSLANSPRNDWRHLASSRRFVSGSRRLSSAISSMTRQKA